MAPRIADAERFDSTIGSAALETESADSATFVTENPTTGRLWGHFALGRSREMSISAVAGRKSAAFATWRTISPTRRGRLMMRWADADPRQRR